MFSFLKDFDFYRKVPKDLTESATHGAILSFCATIFMVILFFCELTAFLTPSFHTNVVIDSNTEAQLTINFNISVLDIPCEFATIDVIDVLGTRTQNISKNINKWQVDKNGFRRNYQGKNVVQNELAHDTHHDLGQLLSNGMHAVPMDEPSFDGWLRNHPNTFVDFYAPWCIWCQRLEPVWEALAEQVESEHIPVSIIKVDCMANQKLCTANKIQAFPTLKYFKNGVFQSPEYRGDRTVKSLIDYVSTFVVREQQLKQLTVEERKQREEAEELDKDDHPGCMLTGTLNVNRVPGHFLIEARSIHHDLNPKVANLSHTIHHLSFGNKLSDDSIKRLSSFIDREYFDLQSVVPIDGNGYINLQQHQSFHHYFKVISTHVTRKAVPILTYQMVASSQMMHYSEEEVPQAVFAYDLSPIAISLQRKGKEWYAFITSLLAIIGGTFTVVGLISNFLGIVLKPKKI